jgi:CBS-domain-containing membrane protein
MYDFCTKGMDTFKAKDVMSSPVVTFRHKEKVGHVVAVLTSCKHHAFPVVLTPKDDAILNSLHKLVFLLHTHSCGT